MLAVVPHQQGASCVCAHNTGQSPRLATTPRGSDPAHGGGEKEATLGLLQNHSCHSYVSPGKELESAHQGCMLPEPSHSLA